MLLRKIGTGAALPLGLLGGIVDGADLRAETLNAGTVQVTATRVEKDLLDVPMAVSVVTEEEIKNSPARTIGELLQDIPGVQVQNAGSQGLKRVSIRGEDPKRVLVLIDGQKIAENKSMDGAALMIDPAMVERIEVIKGPASVLYGSEAIGGVVNIITRKGGTKPLQGEAALGFNGSTGGFDESLSVYGNVDGLKYRLSGSNTRQGALQTPDGKAQHSGFNQWSGSAFLSYDLSDHFTAGGSFDQFYSEIESGDVESKNFFVKINPWKRQKVSLFAEAKNLTDFMPRLRVDGFWQNNKKNMHNHVEASSGPMNVLMDNFANNQNEQFGGTLQADWMVGDNHYLITGYDINRDGLNAKTDTRTNVQTPFGPVQSQSLYDHQGYMLTNALFAQMESRLPWDLTLTYGARQTWVHSQMDRASKTGTTGPGSGGVEGSSWNAKPVFNVGLMWTGLPDTSLRTSFAQGFRVPSLQDKYIISSMGGGTILPNPALKPETSNTWEVGGRYSTNGINFDTTAFYSEADDYIASQIVDQSTNTSRYVNVSKAKTYGVELAASYDLPAGFTPYVSATWLQREFDYGNWKTWKSGTPEWAGRGGVRLLHPINEEVDLVGDVYARFASRSKQETGTASQRTVTRVSAWGTGNAALGVRFGAERQYTLMGEVLNIFNQKYTLNGAILEAGVHANLKLSVAF